MKTVYCMTMGIFSSSHCPAIYLPTFFTRVLSSSCAVHENKLPYTFFPLYFSMYNVQESPGDLGHTWGISHNTICVSKYVKKNINDESSFTFSCEACKANFYYIMRDGYFQSQRWWCWTFFVEMYQEKFLSLLQNYDMIGVVTLNLSCFKSLVDVFACTNTYTWNTGSCIQLHGSCMHVATNK